MKHIAILRVQKEDFTRKQFARLTTMFPDCVDDVGYLELRTATAAPLLLSLKEELNKLGMAPWTDTRRDRLPNEYEYDEDWEYEESDFLNAPVLLYGGGELVNEVVWVRPDGRPVLDMARFETHASTITSRIEDRLKEGTTHLLQGEHHCYMSGAFRNMSLEIGMVGFQFGDQLDIEGPGAEGVVDDYFEIRPSIVMCPLAPETKVMDRNQQPCPPEDFETRGWMLQHLYGPESHYCYRANDLAAMGTFDFAVVRETLKWGWKAPDYLISQRFYQFCLKNKIPGNIVYAPVNVVP